MYELVKRSNGHFEREVHETTKRVKTLLLNVMRNLNHLNVQTAYRSAYKAVVKIKSRVDDDIVLVVEEGR